jgi:hypothetical protein
LLNLLDVVAGKRNVVEAEHSLGHGVVGRVDVHSQTYKQRSQKNFEACSNIDN